MRVPKGDNPKSRANLRKPKTLAERQENGRKGGIRSGEVRSFKASLLRNLSENGLDDITNKLIVMAKHGNMKAIEQISIILDGKPKEQVQIETVNENQFSKLTEAELRALASERAGSDPD